MASIIGTRDKYSLPRLVSPPVPSFFEKGRRVAIYGAGNTGRDVLPVLRRHDVAVECFIDQKAQPGDESPEGVPIRRLDDERLPHAERAPLCVVVAIFNRDTDVPPIIENLKAHGYAEVVSFLDFHHYFASELGDRFWLTSRAHYEAHEAELVEAQSLWEDAESRRLYASILEFRCTGNYRALPAPDGEKQYFPTNVPAWKAPVRFVDCGAYDGDTISDLLAAGIPVEAIAAFEPDQANFTKLADLARQSSALVAQGINLWPCGVYSHSGQLRFSSNLNSASHVSKDGEEVNQCVSLDQALHGFKPTLIKMDIEGAKLTALSGARQIIVDDKPGLAISMYHRPEDIWKLPLLIRSWQCGHKFYLRSYAFAGFELVMYAV